MEADEPAAVTSTVFWEVSRDLSGPDRWKNLPVPQDDQ
jgi:hypothetical protein